MMSLHDLRSAARPTMEHPTPTTTQTLTLGRDENDYIATEDYSEAQQAGKAKGTWLQRISIFPTRSRSRDEEDEDDSYAALSNGQERPGTYVSFDDRLPTTKQRQHPTALLTKSLLAPTDAIRIPEEPVALSAEEQLQQDCSFFYQDMEPTTQNNRKGRRVAAFRTVLPSQQKPSFAYRDAVQVLAPPVLSQYRARYLQLNQEIAVAVPDDLDLADEGSSQPVVPLTRAPQTDSTEHSSLLYQHPSGLVSLKLPMDQVRLLMDPDLEPGILSVEQWRKGDTTDGGNTERPQLHYVLTVQEDLYRKLVAEMSDAVTKPYCGMKRCCNEKEHVDIGVALFLFGLTLVLLLIIILIWPTE